MNQPTTPFLLKMTDREAAEEFRRAQIYKHGCVPDLLPFLIGSTQRSRKSNSGIVYQSINSTKGIKYVFKKSGACFEIRKVCLKGLASVSHLLSECLCCFLGFVEMNGNRRSRACKLFHK